MTEKPSPESIFERVLQCTNPDERTICLDEACGGNEELRREVESLLAAHHAAGSFLDPLVTPEPTTPGEQPGDQIGHYKLLELIGEGGFGRVWMAEQTEPVKRRVALKVIKPGMDSQEVIARFEAERQALALMDHPNIAHVHEAGATESGRPYFVMELVKGIPLTKYCNEHKLGTNERLELFLDICSAIQHAHQKGIIHRDLKPSNILVSPHDGEPIVKVIDFGIAKAIGMELTDKTLFTALGRMIGTPQYMSPEQAELNALDIDTRSDIYSLGVVLYELLTGSTPLDAEKLRSAGYEEMQRMIREELPKKPSTRISELREHSRSLSKDRDSELRALQSATARELDWIVLKALEKERQRRYQTADSFAEDLRRYLADEAVEARPPSALYRLRKIARRHRGGIAAAAAIIITLIAGVATSTYLAISATRAKAQTEREASINRAVIDFVNEDLFPSASPHHETDPELQVRTVVDRASARIDGRFEDQPLVEATIRKTLGSVYFSLGEFEKAQQHLDRAYRLRKRELGENDVETWAVTGLIVSNLYGKGLDLEVAIRLCEQLVEFRRSELGATHRDTLTAMSQLALGYSMTDRFNEGLALSRKTLRLRRESLGVDDPDTLASSNNLAASCHSLGFDAEAETLFKQTIEVARNLEGPARARAIGAITNLGVLFQSSGRPAEAIPLLQEACDLRATLAGRKHPGTYSTMTSLASAYLSVGRSDEALEIYEEALAGHRATLGPEHPDSLLSMRKLAGAHLFLGSNSEALEQAEECLELIRRVSGLNHRQVLDSVDVLANCFKATGREKDALELRQEQLTLTRKSVGSEHPDTLRTMFWLAKALGEAGRSSEAVARFEETLASQRRILGPAHRETLRTMDYLGMAYLEAGRPAEAIEFLEQTLELQRTELGAEHPDALYTMHDLGIACQVGGHSEDALEWWKLALSGRRKILGADHQFTVMTMNSLAGGYHLAGRPGMAVGLAKEVLRARRKGLGPRHKDTLEAMHNLALAHQAANRDDEALRLWEERMALFCDSLGPDHPVSWDALKQLVEYYHEPARPADVARIASEYSVRLRRSGEDSPDEDGLARLKRVLEWAAQAHDVGPFDPEAIARYYVENRESFRFETEAAHIHMITLNLGDTEEARREQRRLAARLRAEIVDGKPLAELARLHSTDLHRDDGGDWDWIEQGGLKEDLDAAIFALEPGSLSEVLEDKTHLRIIRVEERGEYKPLSSVRTQIEAVFEQRSRDDMIRRWLEDARRKLDAAKEEDLPDPGGDATGSNSSSPAQPLTPPE